MVRKRDYDRRISKGLCVHCGKVPPAEDRQQCTACLIYNLAAVNRYRARKAQKEGQ